MKKQIILIIILFLLWSCIAQKDAKRELLTKAITEQIDLELIPERLIFVIKYRYNYDDFNLYRIGGIESFDDSLPDKEYYPCNIAETNGKYLFFYPPYGLYKRRSKAIMKKAVEVGNKVGISKQRSRRCWYLVQSKSTGECTVVQAVNQDIDPYEVPEIRRLLSNQPAIGDIDIVAYNNSLYVSDDYNKNKKQTMFPVRYRSTFTVYNRNDSCLYFGEATDSLGYFAWVNGKDTLRLHTQDTFVEDRKIDDPYYNYDPQKVYRFNISSDEASAFFSKLPIDNFHENLYRLMRDSVFYFPNVEKYRTKAPDSCYYPKHKIQVMFPIECGYDYMTPGKKYYYEKGILRK